MKGPPPKPAHLRQRQNRVAGAALLPTAEEAAGFEVPPLPPREKSTELWHQLVLEWWTSVWKSPMASEYLDSDQRELFLLAELHQQFWTVTEVKTRIVLAGEIRQRSVQFGLTPIDRRRLQWTIDQGERAQERTNTRRKIRETPAVTGEDPRNVLKVVG
jgi:hypothetical protein